MDCAGDEGLYRDLLRKAHGDEQLARKWLRTICGHDSEGPSDLISASELLLFSQMHALHNTLGISKAPFDPELSRHVCSIPTTQHELCQDNRLAVAGPP